MRRAHSKILRISSLVAFFTASPFRTAPVPSLERPGRSEDVGLHPGVSGAVTAKEEVDQDGRLRAPAQVVLAAHAQAVLIDAVLRTVVEHLVLAHEDPAARTDRSLHSWPQPEAPGVGPGFPLAILVDAAQVGFPLPGRRSEPRLTGQQVAVLLLEFSPGLPGLLELEARPPERTASGLEEIIHLQVPGVDFEPLRYPRRGGDGDDRPPSPRELVCELGPPLLAPAVRPGWSRRQDGGHQTPAGDIYKMIRTA